LWTDFFPHAKRGCEAMDERGIIELFCGVLCHDHWKPYYRYDGCLHQLCNAHHSRELTRSFEQYGQQWAKGIDDLLLTINTKTHDGGGVLSQSVAQNYDKQYKEVLARAEIECPALIRAEGDIKRGRLKRSKSRNLLERLSKYEDDVLRFMLDINVPFTNNQGENDIRMTKVQQKISGCFRSMEGAKIFCRVRGYLSTCQKHGVSSSQAMELLFDGKLPEFAYQE
jgi:transposase